MVFVVGKSVIEMRCHTFTWWAKGVMQYFHCSNLGGTLKQAPSNAAITLITGQGTFTLAWDFLPEEIITLVTWLIVSSLSDMPL